MDTDEIAERVARLEEEIEALSASAERSRRIVLVARVAALAGGAWLVAGLLRLVPLQAADLVFALAAVIGGIVFAGSSRSTIQETEASIRRAEALRSRMIDSIDPETVAGSGTLGIGAR